MVYHDFGEYECSESTLNFIQNKQLLVDVYFMNYPSSIWS